MDSAFMNTIAEGLSEKGVRVLRFELPYMQERRETGKKRPPNTQKVLLDCWRSVIDKAELYGPVFIGGKSMGGRMASLLADDVQVKGLICLGYPFHALGKPEKTRVEHLQKLSTPTLILQGTRDAMGSQSRVLEYVLSKAIKLVWLDDGDHDLKPRVKSGITHQNNLDSVIQHIITFIGSTC